MTRRAIRGENFPRVRFIIIPPAKYSSKELLFFFFLFFSILIAVVISPKAVRIVARDMFKVNFNRYVDIFQEQVTNRRLEDRIVFLSYFPWVKRR